MGTDVAEVVDKLPSPSEIKVHSEMCTKLMKIVNRVLKIFPELEADRPRCSSGIQSLCMLNSAIDKAKLLIKDCCESSKLYLALTGSTVLSRCKRSKSLLEQSLSQIQNMYPVMLVSEISQIIAELREVTFSLDPLEEAAGKAVKASLEQYKTGNYSIKEPAIERIQMAASKLRITSHTALVTERRSIKKLLNKLGDNVDTKKGILLFLLEMLRKCSKSIASEHLENDQNLQNQDFQTPNVYACVELQEGRHVLGRANGLPPEEYKCPISHKLMYDPVVIASGQTFERMWIQKWFDEGHDTCPKSKKRLSHFSLIPNSIMKDLITRWCEAHGVTILDPCIQLSTDTNTWENSSSSINSLSMSMNNLQLPVDCSNMSLSSLDNSQSSLSSYARADDESVGFHSFADNSRDLNVDLSRGLDDSIPWESQCNEVENLMARLKNNDQACKLTLSEDLVESVLRFLNNAWGKCDVKAQRIGCLLLHILVKKCRSIRYLDKDAYRLIARFLESEVIEQALAIIEALSYHQTSRSEIAESGALKSILNILDPQIREFQTPALKILYNLTLTRNVHSFIASSALIPKLVPFFEDESRYCLAILTNLCDNHDTRRVIAKTSGCLSFISSVLESESCEEQELALEILLSLCSQSIEYCHLVMNEDVIPSAVSIKINGNEKGRAKATEMLRLLGDINDDNAEESPASNSDVSVDSNSGYKEKKKSSRASRIFSKLSLGQKRRT